MPITRINLFAYPGGVNPTVIDQGLAAKLSFDNVPTALVVGTNDWLSEESAVEVGKASGPPALTFEYLGIPPGSTITAITPVTLGGNVTDWAGSGGARYHSLKVDICYPSGTVLAPFVPLSALPYAVAPFTLSVSGPTTGLELASGTQIVPTFEFGAGAVGDGATLLAISRITSMAFDVTFTEPPPAPPAPPTLPPNWYVQLPGGGLETTPEDTDAPGAGPRSGFDSLCFEFDGRLFFYDSALARTFCFDIDTGAVGGEWTDTGWNTVLGAAVIRSPLIEETLVLHCAPYLVWNPIRKTYFPYIGDRGGIYPIPPSLLMTNRYTGAVVPGQPATPNFRDWPKIVKFRAMDGEGTMMRQRLKRLIKVTVWGEQEPRPTPTRVGWLSVRSDRGRVERYPIVSRRLPSGYDAAAFAALPERTMLADQGFTGNMVGRVFEPMVEFEQAGVTIRDIMMEYIILD